MPSKKEAKWFIRASTVGADKEQIQTMVTTHGSYSSASHHLIGVMGAERGGAPHKHYSKGKIRYDILPLASNKSGEKMKDKKTRTEDLMEDGETGEIRDDMSNKRDRKQIIIDAAQRAKKKASVRNTKGKTASGEKPNEIDMEPELDQMGLDQDGRPSTTVSPASRQA